MTERDMGGPAYPLAGQWYGDKLGGQLHHGMTLWDHYAANAPVLPVGYQLNEQQTQALEWAVSDAAAYADAMLAERRKRMEEST